MKSLSSIFISLCLIAIIATAAVMFIKPTFSGLTSEPIIQHDVAINIWQYECIDTMKTSRDNARRWADRPDLREIIAKEMKLIKETGANCVGISTPYDEEFLPYLTLWVEEARKQELHIWFRGNFSKWENWFEYEGTMSSAELFESAKTFIANNANLFIDEDIFTIAPEAENGGPFEQVEIDEHMAFRAFLIEEYKVCQDAFAAINKKVVCNWFSMNGGLAKRSLDQPTIDAIDKLVTIDHYIKTAPEMGEFINYFYNNFNAKVAVGEFGAPIPEINGTMTEDQQAEFVDKLLDQMYLNRDKVVGVSYWILYDGSTHLINDDYSKRKVYAALQAYFSPARVQGKVIDMENKPLPDVEITDQRGDVIGKTDQHGIFKIPIPAKKDLITFRKSGYISDQFQIEPEPATEYSYMVQLVNN